MVFSRVPVGVCVVDEHHRFTWVNQAFADLMGSEVAGLIGRGFADVTHPDDLALSKDLVRQAFAHEFDYFVMRKRYVRPDGTVWHGDLFCSVTEDDTEPPMAVATLVDAAAPNPVSQWIESLQRSSLVGQMTSGLVHDLRNDLTVLMGAVDLGTAGALNEAVVDAAVEAADHASALTDAMLGFVARDKPSRSVVADVVEQARCLLDLALPPDCVIEIDTAEAGLAVKLSETELLQVLTNLVINARDAIVKQGGTIRVDARLAEDDPACVLLRVSDDGVGMSASDRDNAMVSGFTTKGGRGNGLGLSICKDIVERSGGSIEIESELGQSSCVTLHLPLAHA